MKEFDHIETPESDKPLVEQNIQKQVRFIGSQKKIKGLTMFEYDPVKFVLVPAEYKESHVEIISYPSGYDPRLPAPKFSTVHTLIPKEGCTYVQALNKANAFKKLVRNRVIKIKK